MTEKGERMSSVCVTHNRAGNENENVVETVCGRQKDRGVETTYVHTDDAASDEAGHIGWHTGSTIRLSGLNLHFASFLLCLLWQMCHPAVSRTPKSSSRNLHIS